jgi:hypothetical protein
MCHDVAQTSPAHEQEIPVVLHLQPPRPYFRPCKIKKDAQARQRTAEAAPRYPPDSNTGQEPVPTVG